MGRWKTRTSTARSRCISTAVSTAGKIGLRDGAFFASSDRFDIELVGKGGHGAMPEKAVDPIVGAAELVTLLQTIASREVAPPQPVVVTVGSLHAGQTFNVIPERAALQGTVRAFDESVRQTLPARIERMLAGLCSAMRLEYRSSMIGSTRRQSTIRPRTPSYARSRATSPARRMSSIRTRS